MINEDIYIIVYSREKASSAFKPKYGSRKEYAFRATGVGIFININARKFLNRKEIVVKYVNNELVFSLPDIDSNKTYTIGRGNTITFTPKEEGSIPEGRYYGEIEDESLIFKIK